MLLTHSINNLGEYQIGTRINGFMSLRLFQSIFNNYNLVKKICKFIVGKIASTVIFQIYYVIAYAHNLRNC